MQVRIDKAEKVRAAGMDPYANDFRPELTAAEFHARYGAVDAAALEQVHTVYVKLDRVGESTYSMLKLMDLGDIRRRRHADAHEDG